MGSNLRLLILRLSDDVAFQMYDLGIPVLLLPVPIVESIRPLLLL